jgi:hypothetical protein
LVVVTISYGEENKEDKIIAKFKLSLQFKYTQDTKNGAIIYTAIKKDNNCGNQVVQNFITANNTTCEEITKIYTQVTGIREQ